MRTNFIRAQRALVLLPLSSTRLATSGNLGKAPDIQGGRMRGSVLSLLAGVLLLAGCASTGRMPVSTETQVSLARSNYKVVRAGAKGESHGFCLLGFIPIVSPSFADAKSSLYRSADERLEGRSIALANQTQDESSLFIIFGSIPRITLTADIIEFNE